MKEKDPIQQMIDQLADMLSMVEKNKLGAPEGKLPEGVNEMLDDLESQVQMFREVTEEALREMGISKEEINRRIQNSPPELTTDQKQKLARLALLKNDADNMRRSFGNLVATKKKEEKKAKQDTAKGRAHQHRKRFKRLGGNENWKSI